MNVEALKRHIQERGSGGGDGEVIGYGGGGDGDAELLDACKGAGVVRTRTEAAAAARALDEAEVVFLFRDKVYLHPEKAILRTFNVTQSDMLHLPQKCGYTPPDLSVCKNSTGAVPPPPEAPSTKPPPASPNAQDNLSEIQHPKKLRLTFDEAGPSNKERE